MKGYLKQKTINGIRADWNPYCSVCGKVEVGRVYFKKDYGNFLCSKHINQFNRHGKILKQSRFDDNIIVIEGDIAKIGLNDINWEVTEWCVIDAEDIPKIKGRKWFKRMDLRVVSNTTKNSDIDTSHLRIHNVVMDFNQDENPNLEIDHIDCNTLNNRKSNLRVVTKSKNGMNRGLQSNNSTGVCGVVSNAHDNTSPWMPQIKINGKMIRLGTEHSFDKAVIKRLQSEAELFKINSNNYNAVTQQIELNFLSLDDNIPTTIHVNLQGEITLFTKQSLS